MADVKFTIIIPAYNGGDYLKECVASVQSQTYSKFAIAVLDDGSTDGSLEWLASLDEPRLTLYPAPHHLGIVQNWARAREIPKHQFMTILGQDDLLDANFLAVINALTQKHPDAGLYHAHFRFINARGRVTRACRPLPPRETAAEYLAALFSGQRDTYGTGYVMPSARYDAVGGIPCYEKLLFADDALWMTLMQGAYKATASEQCFSCRLHPQSASGGTGWEAWLAAMPPYIAFLESLAASDPAFAAAYARYAPGYFLKYCRALYTLALTRATRQNRQVDPQARHAIAGVLTQIAPALGLPSDVAQTFTDSKAMRARESINKSPIMRRAYNAYVRARYGA